MYSLSLSHIFALRVFWCVFFCKRKSKTTMNNLMFFPYHILSSNQTLSLRNLNRFRLKKIQDRRTNICTSKSVGYILCFIDLLIFRLNGIVQIIVTGRKSGTHRWIWFLCICVVTHFFWVFSIFNVYGEYIFIIGQLIYINNSINEFISYSERKKDNKILFSLKKNTPPFIERPMIKISLR